MRLEQRRHVLDEIDLVEHDDRRGATVPDRGQVALDAARVEVAVRRADEAEDVDVGGDRLRRGLGVRRAADHRRAPPQDVMDDGALTVVGHGDPIADDRALGAVRAHGAAGQRALRAAPASEQGVDAGAIGGDARRNQTRGARSR